MLAERQPAGGKRCGQKPSLNADRASAHDLQHHSGQENRNEQGLKIGLMTGHIGTLGKRVATNVGEPSSCLFLASVPAPPCCQQLLALQQPACCASATAVAAPEALRPPQPPSVQR